jgi:hypothetical protein
VRWAIVIGVDEYGADGLRLSGAVSDALRFRDWAVSGGGVPADNLRLLLGRRANDPGGDGESAPTKDNIVSAISDVVSAADEADRLYFYFSGHGLMARVAGRDESALVTPGFDDVHTDHSLAVRSLTEHFETTLFKDQFFFIDACRDIPWENREFEIGRWPVPRRRDPGAQPVQQFILYATSPGRKAAEVGFPGEAQGTFSRVLMDGLAGGERAKAWSWERNCYEVRWERLASYVNVQMSAGKPDGVPPERWAAQIPQDAGSRGVAGRDRDPPVVSYASGHFENLALTLKLEADAKYEEVEVSVLDAIGNPVVSAMKVTGSTQKFMLPPRTYAVRALTPEPGPLVGTLEAPIDLYETTPVSIQLRSPGEQLTPEDVAASGREAPPGTISIEPPDPLAVVEIRDEAGSEVALVRAGCTRELPPGFYGVTRIDPEERPAATFVVLPAGRPRTVTLRPLELPAHVAALAEALGGAVEGDLVHLPGAAEPVASAQPSTIVAAAVGAALHGHAVAELGFDAAPEAAGVAVLAVAGDGDAGRVGAVSVRAWPYGEVVPEDCRRLEPTRAGVGAFVAHVAGAGRYWVSIERGDGKAATAIAVSVPVLADRLATLVVQLEASSLRLYQYHPALGAHVSSAPDRLRHVEYLQRLLLAGRLNGAEVLARELAAAAADDPLAGLLAGYMLLRLGRQDTLGELLASLGGLAPGIGDGHILRGEHEAAQRGAEVAGQAFVDAVNAGIPVFAEGLTRLVEGLRANAFVHPRGALVRHLFQRHLRGSMWTVFTPVRPPTPGRLLVSGGDLGFEG